MAATSREARTERHRLVPVPSKLAAVRKTHQEFAWAKTKMPASPASTHLRVRASEGLRCFPGRSTTLMERHSEMIWQMRPHGTNWLNVLSQIENDSGRYCDSV